MTRGYNVKLMSPKYITRVIACVTLIACTNIYAAESWTSFAPPTEGAYSSSTDNKPLSGALPWKTGNSFSDNTFDVRYAPSTEVATNRKSTSKTNRVSVNPWKPTSRWNSVGSYASNERPWGNIPNEKPDRNKKKSQQVTYEQWNTYPEYKAGRDTFLSNVGYGMQNVGLTSLQFTSSVVTPMLYPGGIYSDNLYSGGGYGYPGIYPGGLYGPHLYNHRYRGLYPYPGVGRFGRW